jgi:predicted lipoprotein with Yx(FWY)xxD motif
MSRPLARPRSPRLAFLTILGVALAVVACTGSGGGGGGLYGGGLASAAPVTPAVVVQGSTASAAAVAPGGADYGKGSDYGAGNSAGPSAAGGGSYRYGGGAATPGPSAAGSPERYAINAGTVAALGTILTGERGRTLYTYARDTAGSSACTDSCATNWPPFTEGAGDTVTVGSGVTGTLSTITRADGSRQVTYRGSPLYYYAGDAAPGDVNGQGAGGVWYAAEP